MRYLVLSDIHGNHEALEAVLERMPPHDRLLVLGDLVGYGASPEWVVDRVRELRPSAMVRGNHDKVCSGIDCGENFNQNAQASAQWTKSKLGPRDLAYLRDLQQGPTVVDSLVTICHGSPMDEDFYILYELDAFLTFRSFSTPFCFFGHSHVPGFFVLRTATESFEYLIPKDPVSFPVETDGSVRYLVNPGSVGQPRDSDNRAAYCLLDSETGHLTFHRLEYPVEKAMGKIERSGLPPFLAKRLMSGV